MRASDVAGQAAVGRQREHKGSNRRSHGSFSLEEWGIVQLRGKSGDLLAAVLLLSRHIVKQKKKEYDGGGGGDRTRTNGDVSFLLSLNVLLNSQSLVKYQVEYSCFGFFM